VTLFATPYKCVICGAGADGPPMELGLGDKFNPLCDLHRHAEAIYGDVILFKYRVAFFHPRIAIDWRIPFAVFVEYGEAVFVGIAKLLPSPEYLGSVTLTWMLRHAISEIQAEPIAYRGWGLSRMLGPHFEMGKPISVGINTTSPVDWAVDNVLPAPSSPAP
jgi:hypothetical protein